MKISDLEQELQKHYGLVEGSRVYRTVIPGILGDFLRILQAAAIGSCVREEYRLEDGKGSIVLSALAGKVPADIQAEWEEGRK